MSEDRAALIADARLVQGSADDWMETMIPPWSEAERQRVEALIEQEERFAHLVSNMGQPLKDNEHGRNVLALRARLARAEQADTFEGALRYIAHVLTGDPAAPAALAAEQAKERAEQAEQQIIPVADRERALSLMYAAGGDDYGSPGYAEARRLLKLEDV